MRDWYTSDKGIDLIKSFESFEPDWYRCPAGVETIGYGHARLKSDDFPTPVTQEFAIALLRQDVGKAERAVLRRVRIPLAQHQFDALVSLVYNIGEGQFSTSSLLRVLNEGNTLAAADQFLVWRKAGGKVLPGLERRRQAERALFLGEAA